MVLLFLVTTLCKKYHLWPVLNQLRTLVFSNTFVLASVCSCAVHGKVCGVCEEDQPAGGARARLLHDRRQGGQDARAPGALRRGGEEPGRGGAGEQGDIHGVCREPGADTAVGWSAQARVQCLQGEPSGLHDETTRSCKWFKVLPSNRHQFDVYFVVIEFSDFSIISYWKLVVIYDFMVTK